MVPVVVPPHGRPRGGGRGAGDRLGRDGVARRGPYGRTQQPVPETDEDTREEHRGDDRARQPARQDGLLLVGAVEDGGWAGAAVRRGLRRDQDLEGVRRGRAAPDPAYRTGAEAGELRLAAGDGQFGGVQHEPHALAHALGCQRDGQRGVAPVVDRGLVPAAPRALRGARHQFGGEVGERHDLQRPFGDDRQVRVARGHQPQAQRRGAGGGAGRARRADVHLRAARGTRVERQPLGLHRGPRGAGADGFEVQLLDGGTGIGHLYQQRHVIARFHGDGTLVEARRNTHTRHRRRGSFPSGVAVQEVFRAGMGSL